MLFWLLHVFQVVRGNGIMAVIAGEMLMCNNQLFWEKNSSLVAICQFPWCKYFHRTHVRLST